jgi:protein-S-isoprenylcysteine O-methyltransferase Ste14
MKVMSVIGFVLMVGGIVSLIVTRTIVSPFLPAIVLQVVAFVLMLWARRAFGRRSFHVAADPSEGGLVTTGPYRFIRHPIYTAVCLFVWASVLGSPSIQTAVIAAAATIGAVVRVLCEEHLLLRQYPDYVSYSSRTKRMIPFVF